MSNNFYQGKADTHHKQWEVAIEAGKEKAAKYHMQEYMNYMELLKQ